MTVWYMATGGSVPSIVEVEVIKETEMFVTVRKVVPTGRWMGSDNKEQVFTNRRAKHTDYESYFPTYKEARECLIQSSISKYRDSAHQTDFYKRKMEETIRKFPLEETK